MRANRHDVYIMVSFMHFVQRRELMMMMMMMMMTTTTTQVKRPILVTLPPVGRSLLTVLSLLLWIAAHVPRVHKCRITLCNQYLYRMLKQSERFGKLIDLYSEQ
jgi:hypothetical protein